MSAVDDSIGFADEVVGVGAGFGGAQTIDEVRQLHEPTDACENLQVSLGISGEHKEEHVRECAPGSTERNAR